MHYHFQRESMHDVHALYAINLYVLYTLGWAVPGSHPWLEDHSILWMVSVTHHLLVIHGDCQAAVGICSLTLLTLTLCSHVARTRAHDLAWHYLFIHASSPHQTRMSGRLPWGWQHSLVVMH